MTRRSSIPLFLVRLSVCIAALCRMARWRGWGSREQKPDGRRAGAGLGRGPDAGPYLSQVMSRLVLTSTATPVSADLAPQHPMLLLSAGYFGSTEMSRITTTGFHGLRSLHEIERSTSQKDRRAMACT